MEAARRSMMRKSLLWVLAVGMGAIAGCDDGSANVLGGIPAIAYLSRAPAGTGNVFDYLTGGGDDNLFTLTPPTASGVKKNLTNWKNASINSFDLSFDAREFVFSAMAPGDDHYHLYRINVDGTNPCDAALGKQSVGPCQITDGAYHQVYPIYVPGGRLMFLTTQNVEGAEVPQMEDEYERQTGSQLAVSNIDGSGLALGPRNVSHRVAPSLLSDGRVILTEWQHLGDKNDGALRIVSQDMTNAREAFGNEGKALTNSVLRAREIQPGKVVAIGTSRDRTYQAGKILLINLGGPDVASQSEARSQAVDLTPDVPGDRQPSFKGVGRYYDVSGVGDPAKNQFLVSWSDGFVEDEVNSMAKAPPDFGIYVFDASSKTLQPVVNEVGNWEISPRAIAKRSEPSALSGSFVAEGTQGTLLSAVNVYDSTMFPALQPGQVKRVRITEGFSSEEGFPNMFGLSEFDGQARLGEMDLNPDNSFKAVIPANVPVRIQLIDKYGMAVPTQGPGGSNASEPVWIQGRSGEARACNGCHEDRTEILKLAPGSSALQAANAARFDYEGLTRQERISNVFTADKVMGVPWDKAIQPIFDAHCVDCHDGTMNGANPTYTITDITDMTMFTHTFDLTSKPETINAGDMMYTYSASYISILGPSMAFREKQVMVTGDLNVYMEPGNASASDMIKRINPPARTPAIDLTDRAFPGQPIHPAEIANINGHNGADPKYVLTPDEYYLLILNADSGGQFYFRENKTY
jgi:Hydrazine synthase alpha subunit middle domain